MGKTRKILFFKNYFSDFFQLQSERVKGKIDSIFFLITIVERIPRKFFKHIEGTDGLFEIRVEFEGNIFRIFCCFDEGKLVVLFNGFQKKSQKTPKKEIVKALKIKGEYFVYKKRNLT